MLSVPDEGHAVLQHLTLIFDPARFACWPRPFSLNVNSQIELNSPAIHFMKLCGGKVLSVVQSTIDNHLVESLEQTVR